MVKVKSRTSTLHVFDPMQGTNSEPSCHLNQAISVCGDISAKGQAEIQT